MQYSSDNIHNFTLFAQTSPDSGSTLGYGFVHEGSNRTLQSYPQADFILPVFLTKTQNIIDYIDVTYDNSIFTMERQEINPWFIEFNFFDSIERNKVNEGANLTSIMLNYIRFVRPDVSSLIDADLKSWFDNIGIYELPWNSGQSNQTDLNTLDKISFINQNIVSKAYYLNIDINS